MYRHLGEGGEGEREVIERREEGGREWEGG